MNVYEELSIITDALRKQGKCALATILDDAVSGGATGTEILYRLRAPIKIISTTKTVDASIRKRCNELGEAIEALLM